MYALDLQAQIQQWRQLAAEGKLSEEDAIKAISALRGGNRAAAAVGSTTAKSKKAAPDVNAMLDQLKGL